MALDLTSIQEFVQQVVEAIATALGIEVMVFDPARNIVAGTGVTKIEIGTRYNESSLTGTILVNGHPLITRDPGNSKECQDCFRYGRCPYFVVVAYPIQVENDILGSFCLVATDQQQKAKMLANEEVMIKFLDNASKLIGSAINERRIQEELSLLIKRYDNVVNSVHEGIIAVDDGGKVLNLNRSALELLGGDSIQQFVGFSINQLFPDINLGVKNLVNTGKVEIEVSYQQNKKRKKYFLASIMPIMDRTGTIVRGGTISFRSLKEVQTYAAKLVGSYSKYGFKDIVGESKQIIQVKNKLQRAARTDSTILIRGESGTGKELFAHAVHSSSYRSKGPFIAINCSAIPEALMESELFGYDEGAFTGAKRGGKPGKFELAAGGTLFLDELGDMPLHLQSKLLRVLENHSIERVGGIDSISIDVRIIAATNRNLEDMVERREFRGDLYYRLSVIPVFIPPLRERQNDILQLIHYFLKNYSHIMNREIQELDNTTVKILMNYDWPGNVRELQNTIEYAINMSEEGQIILPEHLPQRVLMTGNSSKSGIKIENNRVKDFSFYANNRKTNNKEIRKIDLEDIKEALERFGTSTIGKEKAAEYLGISRATLYRRIKELMEG